MPQGIAQSGKAPASDAGGRRIEACYPDHIKASRSSAGQSTRFRCERSQDRSLPRPPIGALTGDGAGPVLKTVSTATCGDRDLSAPPFQGRLTGQGRALAGNRAARLKRVGIVRSVFRHHGQSTGRVFGAASKTDRALPGMGIRTSAVCQFSRATADVSARSSGDEKPETFVAATSSGR